MNPTSNLKDQPWLKHTSNSMSQDQKGVFILKGKYVLLEDSQVNSELDTFIWFLALSQLKLNKSDLIKISLASQSK